MSSIMQPHPPSVPETLPTLDLAVRLLGNLAQNGRLTPKKCEKLKELVGASPNAVQAAVWKKVLKGLRSDMLDLEAR